MPRIAVSLAAFLLLALSPAAAHAQLHQHDLLIDKKEEALSLQGGQEATRVMSCAASETALNGSVKVDAVDSPGHPAFVHTRVSRGFGPGSWRFVITNGNQSSRAQIKLYIDCM